MIDLTELDSASFTTAGDEGGAAAAPADVYVLSRADTADCTCPDFCERDHDNE